MNANLASGPWTYDRLSRVVKDADGYDVAVVLSLSHRNDGPVLAAAHELLMLLIESQASIGGTWRARRDAAITKATGDAL